MLTALRASPEPIAAVLPEGERLVDVQCGLGHTVVLSESGKVFTAGDNSEGQLGREGPPHEFRPVEGLPHVTSIHSTAAHTLAVSGIYSYSPSLCGPHSLSCPPITLTSLSLSLSVMSVSPSMQNL